VVSISPPRPSEGAQDGGVATRLTERCSIALCGFGSTVETFLENERLVVEQRRPLFGRFGDVGLFGQGLSRSFPVSFQHEHAAQTGECGEVLTAQRPGLLVVLERGVEIAEWRLVQTGALVVQACAAAVILAVPELCRAQGDHVAAHHGTIRQVRHRRLRRLRRDTVCLRVNRGGRLDRRGTRHLREQGCLGDCGWSGADAAGDRRRSGPRRRLRRGSGCRRFLRWRWSRGNGRAWRHATRGSCLGATRP
jgi:hypothetical protein